MTSQQPEPDVWTEAIEDAWRKLKDCAEEVTKAAEAETASDDDPDAAESLRLRAQDTLRAVVNASIVLKDLQDRSVSRTQWPTDREVRACEQRLGIPEGTYQRGLAARKIAEAHPQANNPPGHDFDYGPALIRICCATVVGALVGAPLGALAIQENILKKMIEAAIVTGLGSIAVEIAGPLSWLARSPDEPPVPVPSQPSPPGTSGLSLAEEVREADATAELHDRLGNTTAPREPLNQLDGEDSVPPPTTPSPFQQRWRDGPGGL